MHPLFPLLLFAAKTSAYWYPNSYTRTPSADEDCYSQASDPYSLTCHNTHDFLYAPCSDLWIPPTPSRPNNFTYYAVCTYPNSYAYEQHDFWSDIMTVEVCENYWDACISDQILAKYNDTIVYGKEACKAVTNKACKNHEDTDRSIPGSQPEDTTLGAFDLGPYSTVSQVTIPRESLGSQTTSSVSGSARVLLTSTTAITPVTLSTGASSMTSGALSSSQMPTTTTVLKPTEASMAGRMKAGMPGLGVLFAALLVLLILLL